MLVGIDGADEAPAVHVINTNERLQLIEVAYRGMVNVAERASAIDALVDRLGDRGFTRVLLDFTGATVAIEDFDASKVFARKLSDVIQFRSCRVAYLSLPGARVNRVVEALAAARGLAFESFDDRIEALQWLVSDALRMKPPHPGGPSRRITLRQCRSDRLR